MALSGLVEATPRHLPSYFVQQPRHRDDSESSRVQHRQDSAQHRRSPLPIVAYDDGTGVDGTEDVGGVQGGERDLRVVWVHIPEHEAVVEVAKHLAHRGVEEAAARTEEPWWCAW